MQETRIELHKAPEADAFGVTSYGQQSVAHFAESNEIDYIGYMTDEECVSEINERAGAVSAESKDFWTAWQRLSVGDVIETTVGRCAHILSLPEYPVHVYLFPWTEEQKVLSDFKGVTAIAPHRSVLHLYIHPEHMQVSGITETVAHEYTHLYYYQTSATEDYTLYEHMLMEGIAEVFREEVVGGQAAPWSIALTRDEVVGIYKNLAPVLDSREVTVHHGVLFGDDTHRPWTGYSIGYHLVKQERQKYPTMEWVAFIAQLRTTQAVFEDM